MDNNKNIIKRFKFDLEMDRFDTMNVNGQKRIVFHINNHDPDTYCNFKKILDALEFTDFGGYLKLKFKYFKYARMHNIDNTRDILFLFLHPELKTYHLFYYDSMKNVSFQDSINLIPEYISDYKDPIGRFIRKVIYRI